MNEELIPAPAVFGGSLTRTFEYRTKGVPQPPQVRWTFSASKRFSCSLLVDQGVIYLGDEQGYFSAIEASSGHLLWRFATDTVTQFAQESNPRSGVIAACLDGAIGYIATEPMLYELDLRNGQILRSWKLDYDELDYDEYDEDDSFDEKCYGSCLDVSGDLLVFFNEWRSETRILRRSTGEWVDEHDHALNVPTIFDGKLYGFYMWNNNGDDLFAADDLDLLASSPVWMYSSEEDQPDPTWSIFLDETHTIPILDGTIFAMGHISSDIPGREDEEGLLALDATTGHLKWNVIYQDMVSRDCRRIAAASDLVFIGTNYGVEAVDIQAHQTRWTRETAVGTTHLFVAAPLLYVVDDEGNLSALDAQTGEPRWNWQGQGDILDKQATFWTIADGTLYVVAGCTLCALS